MKRSINIIFALVLALGGILAGATAGKLLPSVGTFLGSTPASAEGLTAQAAGPLSPSPVGSGFTYQGRLLNNGSPTSGSYDFNFRLYDQASAGSLISGPISVTTIITNGLFTANLDFGPTAFNGDARYMEIATRQTGGGSYTTLSPRQPITPAPYALYALRTKGYKNVVTVAQDGGDFTSITAALNSITNNSSANRYLVWVAPGVYTETVTMKQWVDIEGAGEKSTRITSAGGGGSNTGTVVGANNAELRSITVENTGSATYAIAIYNDTASPSLMHVTVLASGGSFANYGVSNSNASPGLSNVTITATGGANMYNRAVFNTNSSSPSMTNVTASSSGGSGSYNSGVSNNLSSSPSMTNMTITASGGLYDYGVDNANSSSPIMTNVTVTASGGTIIFGVINDASSPRIMSSIITGSGGSGNAGVWSTGGGTVSIDNSKITGNPRAIYNGPGTTTKIGTSQLAGGQADNLGTIICTDSYEGNNKRLGAQCTRNTKEAIVGTTDGDYISIQAALNDVATWCGSPSSANKCIVRVMPGTYTERVTMREYVDIEGSGEDVTRVTFTGTVPDNTGTVVGARNAELRFLTVENTGGADNAIAIYNGGESPSLLHVTARAVGGTITCIGVFNYNFSSPRMTFVTASGSGASTWNFGVLNRNSSSPNMNNVTANGYGGGQSYGVANELSAPSMTNVTAVGSGASSSYGVFNNDTNHQLISMNNVVATAVGNNWSYGVYNTSASTEMINMTVGAYGASENYGVYNVNSVVRVAGSIISADSGPFTYGVYNWSGGNVTIDNSKITGITNTIYNRTTSTTLVGASKLLGGPSFNSGSTLQCAGVYNGSYVFFPNTCP